MISTLSKLLSVMQEHGAVRFYAKKLAPNDNSKNQVYLGGDFSVLNIIPHGTIYTDSDSLAGSKLDRAKAAVAFYWVDEHGIYLAPDAQLILYPKYPEVRMSGFLKGCDNAPSKIMSVRDMGRVLFIGITNNGKVLGYAAGAEHPLAKSIYARNDLRENGVFLSIPKRSEDKDTRTQLLEKLAEVYRKYWIPSKKLGLDGNAYPYSANNGGGYTLEAELGITPNGYSEPDYLGWEIKQYGVNDFDKFRSKSPITLITPEPTGGIYRDQGVNTFIRKYGYADKNGKPNRINFGGIYACGRTYHLDTGLQLTLEGYDAATGKITDMRGGIALLSQKGDIAALWEFTGIMEHWNRKHTQAAYVPSLFRNPPPEYRYGPQILLCEQTEFSLFLKAVSNGIVYYDPGIKMENASSTSPYTKRRSQFRIKQSDLTNMYHKHELVQL